jgi:hypothetical protein
MGEAAAIHDRRFYHRRILPAYFGLDLGDSGNIRTGRGKGMLGLTCA